MKTLLKKYMVFTIGLYLLSMSIVIIVHSTLGTTPISSINYVLSLNTSLTLGACTFLVNMLMIIGQLWLIRGHMFSRQSLMEIFMQIPFSFVFGAFIDLNMNIMSGLHPYNYFMAIALVLLGCLVQATGVVLEVKPQVVMMSAEGFVNYAAKRYNKDFGKLKRRFDISLVTTAILISLIMAQRIEGIREGTIIAALMTGTVVSFISRHILTRKNFEYIKNIF